MRCFPAAAIAAWLGLAAAALFAAPSPHTVTCQLPGDLEQRLYQLNRPGDVWQLSFRSVETSRQWVELPLPGATPQIGDSTASLAYNSPNGGRSVTLRADPKGSSLEIYVNYELEVNVDPDLSPRVDLMNTNGRLTGVKCEIE